MLKCYHQLSEKEISKNWENNYTMYPCGVCVQCKMIRGQIKRSNGSIKYEFRKNTQFEAGYENEFEQLKEELKNNPSLIPIKGFEYFENIDYRYPSIGTCKLPLSISKLFTEQNSNDKMLFIKFVNKEFQRILSETVLDLNLFSGRGVNVEISSFFQVHNDIVLDDEKVQDYMIHIHYLLLPLFQRKNKKSIELIDEPNTTKYEQHLLTNWYKFISDELSPRLKLFKKENRKSFSKEIRFPQSLTNELSMISEESNAKESDERKLFWASRLTCKAHLYNYMAYINKFSLHGLVDFREKIIDGNVKIIATIKKAKDSFVDYVYEEEEFFDLLLESHGGTGFWSRRGSSGLMKSFKSANKSEGISLVLRYFKDNSDRSRIKRRLTLLLGLKCKNLESIYLVCDSVQCFESHAPDIVQKTYFGRKSIEVVKKINDKLGGRLSLGELLRNVRAVDKIIDNQYLQTTGYDKDLLKFVNCLLLE